MERAAEEQREAREAAEKEALHQELLDQIARAISRSGVTTATPGGGSMTTTTTITIAGESGSTSAVTDTAARTSRCREGLAARGGMDRAVRPAQAGIAGAGEYNPAQERRAAPPEPLLHKRLPRIGLNAARS
jgi:hypothetical protein